MKTEIKITLGQFLENCMMFNQVEYTNEKYGQIIELLEKVGFQINRFVQSEGCVIWKLETENNDVFVTIGKRGIKGVFEVKTVEMPKAKPEEVEVIKEKIRKDMMNYDRYVQMIENYNQMQEKAKINREILERVNNLVRKLCGEDREEMEKFIYDVQYDR